ncbi:MAG: hypothetical protein AAF799_37620 [Myxococcota bacterium]
MAPRPAEACSPDPCQDSNRWVGFDLSGTIIAPDGVLRFSAERLPGPATTEDALAYVEVTVTDEMGATIDGALEYHDDYRAYAWRPAESLTPSSAYGVSINVDNDALAEALDEKWIAMESFCGENFATVGMIETASEPLEALSLPDPLLHDTHHVVEIVDLDTLACCNGAYPLQEDQGCGWYEVSWADGHCSSTMASGTLEVEGRISFVEPEVLANTVVRLVQTDGDRHSASPAGSLAASFRHDSPLCVQLEGYDLAHGTTWLSKEECFGEGIADQLGVHETDPTDELWDSCTEQPYTCESVDGAWDPKQCMPFGPPFPAGSDEELLTDDGTVPGETGLGTGSQADGSGTGVGTGDGGGGGQDDDVSGRGCSCQQSGHTGGLAGLWLLVAGAALRRRRR